MADVELPAGRYVFTVLEVRAGSGGLSRAVLLRNRLFAERAGVQPTLLALRPHPDYPERKARLVEEGLLSEQTPVLSVYDYLRLAPSGTPPADAPLLEPLPGTKPVEEARPDGHPFRTVHRDRLTGADTAWDYRRPDGTVHLRVLAGRRGPNGAPRARTVAPDGRVVRSFASMPAFHRYHLRVLFPPPGRVFLFLDNRVSVPLLVPAPGARFHVICMLHNQHTTAARRWDSPMTPSYARAMKRLPEMHALVTLTERQRADVRLRLGPLEHLFVVPNTVLPPPIPEPRPARDPRRLVVVSRMAPQKNLGDALRAFRLVLDARPDARLDVYGDGPERARLERLCVRLRLTAAVTLHGFRPLAEADLWSATALLLTSRFEGYPLATLEALAHGCPVVAYDVRYGLREQVTHGVDGYIVPPGDVRALAARAVTLLDNPAVRDRMSDAALRKAAAHGPDRLMADWKQALDAVVELAPRRTRLDAVRLEVQQLTSPTVTVRRLLAPPSKPFLFEGVLRVTGVSADANLDDATVVLTALGNVGGVHAQLPLAVTRDGSVFRLRLATTTSSLFTGLGRRPSAVQLRLLLTWRNSSWQALLEDGASWARPLRPTSSEVVLRRLHRRARRLAAAVRRRVRRPATPR
jgi:poly(glycerol-phosphate) alpha-glucosyltransferase